MVSKEGCKNIDILFHGSLVVFHTRCSETIECLFPHPLFASHTGKETFTKDKIQYSFSTAASYML